MAGLIFPCHFPFLLLPFGLSLVLHHLLVIDVGKLCLLIPHRFACLVVNIILYNCNQIKKASTNFTTHADRQYNLYDRKNQLEEMDLNHRSFLLEASCLPQDPFARFGILQCQRTCHGVCCCLRCKYMSLFHKREINLHFFSTFITFFLLTMEKSVVQGQESGYHEHKGKV